MNIGNTRSFNEDRIISTEEFQFEHRPTTINIYPDQNTLKRLVKRSKRNRDVLEIENTKGKIVSRSTNDANIKSTKAMPITYPLKLIFYYSPQDQSLHYEILCPLQSLISDTSI